MISTRDLSKLPDIASLRDRLQQLATLADVVGIDYGGTDFEFHPKWAAKEQMGAYKNGSGDELFAHFTPAGCFIKGFAHESAMSPFQSDPPKLWPGLLESVPTEFKSSLQEPAFDMSAVTFAIWRLKSDDHWQTDPIKFPKGDDPDGSAELLEMLVMTARQFAQWLTENYEIKTDADIAADVFAGKPLTNKQLRSLNPDATLKELRRAVKETGYPLKSLK
jgi:hypothetical protein